MPILPYDYLHLVNCTEVVTISDNYCTIISEYLASQTIAHFMVEEALERLLLPSSSLSVVPSTGL